MSTVSQDSRTRFPRQPFTETAVLRDLHRLSRTSFGRLSTRKDCRNRDLEPVEKLNISTIYASDACASKIVLGNRAFMGGEKKRNPQMYSAGAAFYLKTNIAINSSFQDYWILLKHPYCQFFRLRSCHSRSRTLYF